MLYFAITSALYCLTTRWHTWQRKHSQGTETFYLVLQIQFCKQLAGCVHIFGECKALECGNCKKENSCILKRKQFIVNGCIK